MKLNHVVALTVCVAAVGLSGCGETCPTETPAKIDQLQSCTVRPGETVSVRVRLCPTCNQTAASCEVDTSQASTGFIQLDPTVEACEDVTSCPSLAPACQAPAEAMTCTFTAPSNEDVYTLLVFDPSTNGDITATLTVDASATPSCAFASALSSGL
jgi:hypothetical protein